MLKDDQNTLAAPPPPPKKPYIEYRKYNNSPALAIKRAWRAAGRPSTLKAFARGIIAAKGAMIKEAQQFLSGK